MKTDKRPADDLSPLLQEARTPSARHRFLYIMAGALILAAVGGIALFTSGNGEGSLKFRTAEIQKGDLTIRVTATGELRPLNQVDVGTEISGTVESVAVDFNDKVRAGQVLARLDTELLEAKLKQTRAALDLSRARVREAEATVTETRAKVERVRDLSSQGIASKESLDAAEAAYSRAEAALATAAAQLQQARAQLESDETNLRKAVMKGILETGS